MARRRQRVDGKLHRWFLDLGVIDASQDSGWRSRLFAASLHEFTWMPDIRTGCRLWRPDLCGGMGCRILPVGCRYHGDFPTVADLTEGG